MENHYSYSASQNVFLMNEWHESYVAAGSWPDDAVEVTDIIFNEFSVPAAGKIRVAGSGGLPAWTDIPPPTADELIATAKAKQQALINEASSIIAPLKDALDGGYIDDEDKPRLTAWQKYRYALTKVDPAKPAWPDKPAQ